MKGAATLMAEALVITTPEPGQRGATGPAAPLPSPPSPTRQAMAASDPHVPAYSRMCPRVPNSAFADTAALPAGGLRVYAVEARDRVVVHRQR